jgi:hypothetical protein
LSKKRQYYCQIFWQKYFKNQNIGPRLTFYLSLVPGERGPLRRSGSRPPSGGLQVPILRAPCFGPKSFQAIFFSSSSSSPFSHCSFSFTALLTGMR